MPGVSKAILHGLIRDVFVQACHSPTPLSTVAQWSVQFRDSSKLSHDEVDQIADTVVRMVALQRRAFGESAIDTADFRPQSPGVSPESDHGKAEVSASRTPNRQRTGMDSEACD